MYNNEGFLWCTYKHCLYIKSCLCLQHHWVLQSIYELFIYHWWILKAKVNCYPLYSFMSKSNLFLASVTEHLLLTKNTISNPSINSLSYLTQIMLCQKAWALTSNCWLSCPKLFFGFTVRKTLKNYIVSFNPKIDTTELLLLPVICYPKVKYYYLCICDVICSKATKDEFENTEKVAVTRWFVF